MLKTIFLTSLKFLLAGALITWLLQSGKLDFKLLGQLKNHPFAVTSAVAMMLTNLVLASYRWKKILTARTSVDLPLAGMMQISWIGLFFSSVLPGSVSGDLVKILYVQNYDRNLSKKFLFASI